MRIFAIILAFVSVSCASTSNSPISNEERLSYIADSRESNKSWIPVSRLEPIMPRSMASSGINGCVVVGFLINSNGDTENPRILNSWPSDPRIQTKMQKSAIAAIDDWKFRQGAANPELKPSKWVTSFNFEMLGVTPWSYELWEKCRIIGNAGDRSFGHELIIISVRIGGR